jgi:hypothetical protein
VRLGENFSHAVRDASAPSAALAHSSHTTARNVCHC